jgi:hypothetical protein
VGEGGQGGAGIWGWAGMQPVRHERSSGGSVTVPFSKMQGLAAAAASLARGSIPRSVSPGNVSPRDAGWHCNGSVEGCRFPLHGRFNRPEMKELRSSVPT